LFYWALILRTVSSRLSHSLPTGNSAIAVQSRSFVIVHSEMTSAIDLSKMSPEQLAQMPAGVPPLGVIPNLVDPHNVGNYILIANSLMMAMMIIFVALRFYVVFAIKRRMEPDDWTVVAGLVGSCYYFVVVCLGKVRSFGHRTTVQLTQALAVKVANFGTHMWDLSVLHMRTRDVAVVSHLCRYRTAYEAHVLFRLASCRTDHHTSSGLASKLRSSNCFGLWYGFAVVSTSVLQLSGHGMWPCA
jgi:hypothetical protein